MHRGPIRFGVTERHARSRMPKTIYLYQPERMTDGKVGPPIPSGTDDGWGVLARPYPSVERKKIDFWKTIQGRGGPKYPHVPSTMTTPLVTTLHLPPSHPYYERVTPRLEKEGGVGKFRKISIPILKCIFLMNNQHEQTR
jgi:hypothetical protein